MSSSRTLDEGWSCRTDWSNYIQSVSNVEDAAKQQLTFCSPDPNLVRSNPTPSSKPDNPHNAQLHGWTGSLG